MNILVVSSYLPFPLHSGGDVRLYNLLVRLAKKHSLTLVAEKRSFQTEKDVKEIEKICKTVITFPRKKQWSAKNILKSGTSSHSFLITGHTLPEMKKKISELLNNEIFDLIHVETSYVMQNLPKTKIPVVLTEHNVEYLVYKRFTDEAIPLFRPLMKIDVEKLCKEEVGCWRNASKVVAVSEKEKDVIQKEGIDVAVVPNGVDTEIFRLKDVKNTFEKKEKRILFIGDYKWIQNKNAASWILSEIWPKIRNATTEEVKLWLVGRNMPKDFRESGDDRIIAEGSSDRPAQDIFSDAFVLLSPLKVAGGTQYKILESMAVGTPVVTTELGVEGLGLTNKEIVQTAQTTEGLVEKILDLLNDEKRYKEISSDGREHIEEHFSFDSIAERLDKVYDEVIKNEKN